MIGMIDDDVRLIILTFLSQSHTQQNINSQAMFYNIKIPSRHTFNIHDGETRGVSEVSDKKVYKTRSKSLQNFHIPT